MQFLSTRLNDVSISETAKIKNLITEKESAGERVLSLSVGEPNFNTPQNVINAAKKGLDKGFTKYTHTTGLIELKEAIRTKYLRENNLDYELNEIIVCSGGKQVIFNAFLSTLSYGDEVIIPSPYWVSYPEIVKLCGAKPIIAKTKLSSGYKLRGPELQSLISRKTKWLILNSPSNPTGAVYTREELIELSSVLKKYPEIWIMSDDIYEHIVFENQPALNIVQLDKTFKNRTLLINGVSKGYAMTGWRIGYGAGHSDLIDAMNTIQSQSTSNAPSVSQYAAIEAISNSTDFVEKNKLIFQKRRDLLFAILNQSKNMPFTKPMGAFYALPSIEALIGQKTSNGQIINSDIDFTIELLKQTGVAVVSGSAFGAPNSFRISYAVPDNLLKEACNLIVDFVKRLN